jgi:hypothetical protein
LAHEILAIIGPVSEYLLLKPQIKIPHESRALDFRAVVKIKVSQYGVLVTKLFEHRNVGGRRTLRPLEPVHQEKMSISVGSQRRKIPEKSHATQSLALQ